MEEEKRPPAPAVDVSQDSELNTWAIAGKFRAGAISTVFAIMVGAIIGLFIRIEKLHNSCNAEKARLEMEVKNCLTEYSVAVERLKNEQINAVKEVSLRQDKIERNIKKIEKKL